MVDLNRYRAILECATPASHFHWLKRAAWLGGLISDGHVADKVIDAMESYLEEAELA